MLQLFTVIYVNRKRISLTVISPVHPSDQSTGPSSEDREHYLRFLCYVSRMTDRVHVPVITKTRDGRINTSDIS